MITDFKLFNEESYSAAESFRQMAVIADFLFPFEIYLFFPVGIFFSFILCFALYYFKNLRKITNKNDWIAQRC